VARKDRLLVQQAYDELKRRIITLEIEPGARIDDFELSADLEFSRTPVREAIFLLAAERLVDIGPRGGFVVRPLDLLDIRHLFEAHIVVAKAVAGLAARRVTAADLEAMAVAVQDVEQAIGARDYLTITIANARLHKLEAAAAHSRHLRAMADSIHDQGQRLAYLCFGGGHEWGELDDHFARVREHHDGLIRAYRARDADAAAQTATEHVKLFRRRVQAYLESEAPEPFTISPDDIEAVAL
jgi:DNA-binding GntR family transcriptional regulator